MGWTREFAVSVLIGLCASMPLSCKGQGTVHFANRVGGLGYFLVDAPFRDYSGRPLSGSNYVAQLYVGTSPGDLSSVGLSTPFVNEGYFTTQIIELPMIVPGGSVWVQVRAWDTAGGPTYEEAVAARKWNGVSTVLYIIPGNYGVTPTLPASLIGLQFVPSVDPALPVIVTQPFNQIGNAEAPLTVSVNTTNGLVTYQWRFSGHTLGGETNATLVITGAKTNQSGLYDVIVSNAFGSITSAVAQVSIYPASGPPFLRAQPQDQLVRSGENVTLHTVATGGQPIYYQWFQGISGDVSSPIAGATNMTYVVTNVNTTFSIWTRVNNSLGAVDSRNAIVKVFPAIAPVMSLRIVKVNSWPRSWATSITVDGQIGQTYALSETCGLKPPGWTGLFSFAMPSGHFTFTYPVVFAPEPPQNIVVYRMQTE